MKRYKIILYSLLILALAILAWYKVLGFWFFKGNAPNYLIACISPEGKYYPILLLRCHAFLSLLNFKLFGWNPTGWYLIGLILHTVATFLIFRIVYVFSKKAELGLLVAILFVANIAYHDVITWGSFNSYYSLMLIWFLLAILFFRNYREERKKIFYFLSLFICILAPLTRESGVITPFLLLSYDIIYHPPKRKKHNICLFIRRHLPFFLIIVAYLIFRTRMYGPAIDSVDSQVKLRFKLLSEYLYIPYLGRAALTFGRHLIAQPLPYPLLNVFRYPFFQIFNDHFVSFYFFPLLGWLLLIFLALITWSVRQKKLFYKIMLFALVWIILQTALISLAFPNTDSILAREYGWNTRRYVYYSFFGMCLFFGTFFYFLYTTAKEKFKKLKRRVLFLFILIISMIIIVNIFLLHQVENYLLKTVHRPARQFYTSLKTFCPNLAREHIIYQYPQASGLSDFIFELNALRKIYYPNLEKSIHTECQMARVLEALRKKEVGINEVFFFDYSPETGLQDYSQKARELILNPREITIPFRKTISTFKISEVGSINFIPMIHIPLKNMPPVEIPYQVEIRMKANSLENIRFPFSVFKEKEEVSGRKNSAYKEMDIETYKTLVDFAKERKDFLENATVEVSATKSQRPGEPFLHLVPKNLINGNFGRRSKWIADSRPAWIIIDLHRAKIINGVFWSSCPDSKGIPSNYSFYVSSNGIEWHKVKEIKRNKATERIEIFDKPVRTRYIKMVIETTSQGDFTLLDELEAIGPQGMKAVEFYKNGKRLTLDSLHLFAYIPSEVVYRYAKERGINWGWGKIYWLTNDMVNWNDEQSSNFFYIVDGQFHIYTIDIKECEFFNGPDEFLSKFLTDLRLDLGEYPAEYEIDYIKLKPKFRIKG